MAKFQLHHPTNLSRAPLDDADPLFNSDPVLVEAILPAPSCLHPTVSISLSRDPADSRRAQTRREAAGLACDPPSRPLTSGQALAHGHFRRLRLRPLPTSRSFLSIPSPPS